MFKCVAIVFLLALTGAVRSQEAASGGESAAAEPYSYGYETDSHSASEQRDPSGKVTGFYTIQDADGRSRRVEYTADESGFKAKVVTNEVGTKSESPADVDMQASPPTEAQYSSQYSSQYASGVQQAAAPALGNVLRQQSSRYASSGGATYGSGAGGAAYGSGAGAGAASAAQQAANSAGYSSSYYQQVQQRPAQAGYSSSSSSYQYGQNQPGYIQGYAPAANQVGYTTSQVLASGAPVGYNSGHYSTYNNHLPSQYYRSVQQQQQFPVSGQVSKYTTSSVTNQPASYSSGGYRASYSSNSASAPGAVSYSAGPSSSYASRTVSSGGNPLGSSNYIVLKKRDAESN